MVLMLVAVCGLATLTAPADAHETPETVTLIALNVDQGHWSDTEFETVIDVIDEIRPANIWIFTEFNANWRFDAQHLAALESGLGEDYQILTAEHSGHRVAIAYDAAAFEYIDHGEIHMTNILRWQTRPLWVQLRENVSETVFYVLAVQLVEPNREDALRIDEARDLHAWALNHEPAIAVGSFNLSFDTDFTDMEQTRGLAQRSAAFDALVANDVWAWIRPSNLTPSESCEPDTRRRETPYVQEFAFVAGEARNWPRDSVALVPDCENAQSWLDRLPLQVTIELPSRPPIEAADAD